MPNYCAIQAQLNINKQQNLKLQASWKFRTLSITHYISNTCDMENKTTIFTGETISVAFVLHIGQKLP
jgi:hypothetical protein